MSKDELIAIFLALRMCYKREKAENLFRKIVNLLKN